MIKYFEAFAGIGAFRSAFEKVGGFECVGWCEIDRFAQKAYRTLYDTKGEIFYEDITKIDYGNMPDFDLLVGGPCCQSFSVAGRRLAFEDDRGNLFFNYIQILEASAPVTLSLKTYPTCLVYRSQEEGCSLSDILETNVPQKYWLSEEMMRKIAKKENLNS